MVGQYEEELLAARTAENVRPVHMTLERDGGPDDFHVKDKDLEIVGLNPYRSFDPVFGDMAREGSLRWAHRFYDEPNTGRA